jgi:mono/diheme cytochrome c family protein
MRKRVVTMKPTPTLSSTPVATDTAARPTSRIWVAVLLALGFAGLIAATVLALNLRGEDPVSPTDATPQPGQISRGAYLALAGNCAGCHTARGGAAYAGGRGIETPFGVVYAPNLTPDPETGLGRWSASEFWRALHNGRSKDGRLLYPAFPYPSYTRVSREDSDAIYAYLRSLPPVRQAATPHALRFPYNLHASLAVWRALYFKPGSHQADASRSEAWNRGAYLVQGLGHCEACHAERNALGATQAEAPLGGGLIPMQNWYAPSLASASEAGVGGWTRDEIVALLRDGRSDRASVMGPMAEVVFRSTQHLRESDLQAMAEYLQSVSTSEPRHAAAERAPAEQMEQGEKVYRDQCSDCHGEQGQGVPGAYPPLAGNRAVTVPSPNNVIKAIVHGGFAPTTTGNPRPYGMPPFGRRLSEAEIAAVATYIRQSWGQQAAPVRALDVLRAR